MQAGQAIVPTSSSTTTTSNSSSSNHATTGAINHHLASYQHPHLLQAFKVKFPVSAKTSFVVMAPFYVFWMESERSVGRCRLKGENNKHMHHDKLTGGVDHREHLFGATSSSSSSSPDISSSSAAPGSSPQ
jgi:hypothetical protein